MLEHVWDVDETVTAILKLLRPGGRFCLAVPVLYATREDWSAGKVAVSVYYRGVPDTTSEFALEASMLSYLATASSARR